MSCTRDRLRALSADRPENGAMRHPEKYQTVALIPNYQRWAAAMSHWEAPHSERHPPRGDRETIIFRGCNSDRDGSLRK